MASAPKQPSSDFEPDELDFMEKLGASLKFKGCPPPDLLQAARAYAVPEELKDAVQQHLRGCRVCQILAADLEQIQAAITSEEGKRIRERVFSDTSLPKQSRSWRWFWAIVPAAAVAAICLLIVWNRYPAQDSGHSTSAISSATATVFILKPPTVSAPIPLVMRGTSENRETYLNDLMRALAPYRAGNYAEAAKSLNALAQKYPTSPEVAFYLGVSLLMEGKNADAANTLQRAETLVSGPLGGACQWYRAIADVRSGHAEAAVAPLQDLCNRPGEYQARACAGLKELSSSHQSTLPR